jgi:hypothetical protein
MSEKDLEAWEHEFQPEYSSGLDQAIIQDIGEFVVHMIAGMKLSDYKDITSWASKMQASTIPDRYIRDIHHWFLVHSCIIVFDELDPDDRRRLNILIERCRMIVARRKS